MTPELLSPAGSPEALLAAINGGADAVYFGGRAANARENAKNFSDAEICSAVKLLHDSGKRAYITLNTLQFDREIYAKNKLSNILKFAETCINAGADAFITQDIGLSRVLLETFPGIDLHASTQCACHNSGGAVELSKLGFSRVVAARELSESDLRVLAKNSPIGIEIFVHGALCSSHSGRCLLSSAIGGGVRSANRGKCAQPCRMKYNGTYPLSLKDNCLAGHIKDILSLGVISLKIEGRMKPPEYVYAVTKAYRLFLDESRNASPDEIASLARIFSRDGFTDGYFTGQRGKSMYGIRTDSDKADSRDAKYPVSAVKRIVNNADITTGFNRNIPTQTKYVAASGIPVQPPAQNIKINPKLLITLRDEHQLNAALYAINADNISRFYRIFVPESLIEAVPQERRAVFGVTLPDIIFDRESESAAETLARVKSAGFTSAMCANFGHVQMIREAGLVPFGADGFNITNSASLQVAKDAGLAAVTLSSELNFAQISGLAKCINCGISAYGRTKLFISENKTETEALADRTGSIFPVLTDSSGRSVIYNSVPIYLADTRELYRKLGLFYISLDFTVEDGETTSRIIREYLTGENVSVPAKFTRMYNN
ncbi:hypothetical protein FACS1894105_08690 [Clostridia bacterium]|nr:hypothetical protein FACS1894105_08690 [Clostridia bacterium]